MNLDAILLALHREQDEYANRTVAERALRMHLWAERIRESAEVMGRDLARYSGQPEEEGTSEAYTLADTIDFFAGASRTLTAPRAGRYAAGTWSSVALAPLGVVAAILPFNYPLLLLGWRVGAILAGGNAAAVKPDPRMLGITAMAIALARDVTLPVQLVPGGVAEGRLLVEHRLVDGVAFTGSPEAGADVRAHAGVRPVSLELGGSNAAIILPDAPDTSTRERLVAAITYNGGQSCAAPSRIIVVGTSVEARDWAEYIAKHPRMAHGYHRLIDSQAAARYIRVTREMGGEPILSPTANGDTVTAGVTLMALGDSGHQPEPFGPFVAVYPALDLYEAIAVANDSEYGLAASVWTQDVAVAHVAAANLRVGEVWVNCHLVQSPELPHGGYGQSGSGTDMSADAIRQWTRTRTTTVRLS